MSGNSRPAVDSDALLEAFVAEVTGTAYPIIASESWVQDVLDSVFNSIPSHAAQATAERRVPPAMPTWSGVRRPPPR